MPSARRDMIRSFGKWSREDWSSVRRREPRQWIVRWIGASRRRSSGNSARRGPHAQIAGVEYLSWEDTFGKPASPLAGESL